MLSRQYVNQTSLCLLLYQLSQLLNKKLKLGM